MYVQRIVYTPLVSFFLIYTLSARILINEALYDPIGTDTGYEWIELFNAGSEAINLEGAQIQKGGASFQNIFTFPHYILRPGRFVVVGEMYVSQAAFICNLAFQNGGSETDGIRYVSPDSLYTDTLLYDEPNLNLLPDDSGAVATGFAIDVSAGYSLARIMDGFDTDRCEVDFIPEENPTPGIPNPAYCDYALGWVDLTVGDGLLYLGISLKNHSLITPAISAELRIYLNQQHVSSVFPDAIPAMDSLWVEHSIDLPDEQNHHVSLELVMPNDPDTTNNIWTGNTHGLQNISPRLNEFMYHPQSGAEEWIELHLSSDTFRSGSYSIKDFAGNSFSFELPHNNSEYMLLCNDKENLLQHHPECSSATIIEVTGWAALNNEGDAIFLCDESGVVIDSVLYQGNTAYQGKSLERSHSDLSSWRYSTDPSGATPGRINSTLSSQTPEFSGRISLQGSPFNPQRGDILRVYFQNFDPDTKLNLAVYDLQGRLMKVLADKKIIGEIGKMEWDGRNNGGAFVPRGLYLLLWESQAGTAKRIYKKQLSAVVWN